MNESFTTLCQLCSPNTHRDDIKADDLDWSAVWKLALRHRVVPVMADGIKRLGISVPSDTAELIGKNVQQNLQKGMKQAAELVQLTKLFEENDIPFVAFKGIALIKLTGLDLHQRHHGDIDILLASTKDLHKAEEILIGTMGYHGISLKNLSTLNKSQKKHFLTYQKDIGYFNEKSGINIELHFKILPSNTMLPASSSQIFKNRTEFTVGQNKIPCMNKQQHQIYLLLHGSISRWFRLKWLCDIPFISDNGQSYCNDSFVDSAKKNGHLRMVVQGLCMSNDLLLMPIMNSIRKENNNNKKILFLTNESKKFITSTKNLAELRPKSLNKVIPYYSRLLKYKLTLMKGWTYKKDVIHQNFTDNADWEKLCLPSRLFYLYYLLRPFLWLKRQL